MLEKQQFCEEGVAREIGHLPATHQPSCCQLRDRLGSRSMTQPHGLPVNPDLSGIVCIGYGTPAASGFLDRCDAARYLDHALHTHRCSRRGG